MRSKIISAGLILFALQGCVQDRLEHGNSFTRDAVTYGSKTDEKTCNQRKQTVWVEYDGVKECIKYYAAGLKENNPISLVHVPGDIATVYFTKLRVTNVSSSYLKLDENQLNKIASANASRTKLPFIFLARPGIFGSSGHHGLRLREINIRLVDAALDAIKKKHNINRLSISGQSGGGRIVSALLNWRDDISCAVLASSAGSMLELMEARRPGQNMQRFASYVYDPYQHMHMIKPDTNRQIYVISDKEDEVVKNWVQDSYYKKLKDLGHQATFLNLSASGKRKHGLTNYASTIAKGCAKNIQPDEMQAYIDRDIPVSIYNSFIQNSATSNKISSATTDKKSFTSVTISWQPYASSSTTAWFKYKEKTFGLSLYDNGFGYCEGNYDFASENEGKWKITCPDENIGTGQFQRVPDTNTFIGNGTDQKGNSIKFEVEFKEKAKAASI